MSSCFPSLCRGRSGIDHPSYPWAVDIPTYWCGWNIHHTLAGLVTWQGSKGFPAALEQRGFTVVQVPFLLALIDDWVWRATIHRAGYRIGQAWFKPNLVPSNGGVGLWDGDRLWVRSSEVMVYGVEFHGND